ncbi:AAA family ATPase [Aerosticca soli]|uniref:AAA+ ATPase domain-containing protein n=1 Tax=Aerosticca soli TaxID=2010829 RepID=A0A2Z6E4Y2_9GAMM|nr:AAA family ATPase [Aerosticca soli]BBD80195.1 hypothetical protein ALSL_1540 [Aerosticca soli]
MINEQEKEIGTQGAKLKKPTRINIVVGRNGSGKSTFLRELSKLGDDTSKYHVSYLSPERAGEFVDDANVSHNIQHNPTYLKGQRDKNQAADFKKASKLRLKELADRWGLRLDNDPEIRKDSSRTFDSEFLVHINQMLSNVTLRRERNGGFAFFALNGDSVTPAELSSGESEVVSLASEVMHFFDLCEATKTNLLILDEPDVHLHPDLQAKFARFVIGQIGRLSHDAQKSSYVILATHSTPMICEFAISPMCSIGTKELYLNSVTQRPIAETFKNIAPFFGHPLSRFIGGDVPLIVEGEDDVRVWNQACRTSEGKIRVFPCLAHSKPELNALERSCDGLMRAIYDDPKALSIRDGDGDKSRKEIGSEGCVVRHVLHCYEMENILLTDDCLSEMRNTWDEFKAKAETWIKSNQSHPEVNLLKQVIGSSDRGRDTKLKKLRNIIVGISEINKDWEIVVGQTIGRLAKNKDWPLGEFSLYEFVGAKAIASITNTKSESDLRGTTRSTVEA